MPANTDEFKGFYIERVHPEREDAFYCLHVYAPTQRQAIRISKYLGRWPYAVALKIRDET